MYKLQVEIDHVPQSLNVVLAKHYWQRKKARDFWDAEIKRVVGSQLPDKPLEYARILLVRHSNRMLDYDGLVGSFKYVVDALVDCGVLSDDSWQVTGKWDVQQKYMAQKEGKKITIRVVGLK